MPATSFVPTIRFEWPPPPPPAPQVQASAPAAPLKKPKKGKARFRPAHLTLLSDRVEVALAAGVIDLHPDWAVPPAVEITAGELIKLYAIFLPEAFGERPAPPVPLASAPGSPLRVEEYLARREAGVGLFDPRDATLADGKAEVRERKNGSGLEVVGWEGAKAEVWRVAKRAARRAAEGARRK